jgi:hypothetical protein
MNFPFQIFGVCTAEEYYAATTDWSQDFAVGCPVLGAFPRAGILGCDSKSNGSRVEHKRGNENQNPHPSKRRKDGAPEFQNLNGKPGNLRAPKKSVRVSHTSRKT